MNKIAIHNTIFIAINRVSHNHNPHKHQVRASLHGMAFGEKGMRKTLNAEFTYNFFYVTTLPIRFLAFFAAIKCTLAP